MEGASSIKYVDFMGHNVLAPAGMEQTQVDDRLEIVPYRTRFYPKTDSGRVENADFLDSSYKIPGGGRISSAEDMAKFEVAILNDRLIKRSTRDLMWTPLKPSKKTATDWDGESAKKTAFESWDTAGASRAPAPISRSPQTSALE